MSTPDVKPGQQLQRFSLRSWSRFSTFGICIAPELIGHRHDFEFDDHHVVVVLPGLDKVDRPSTRHQVASCSHWLKTSEGKVPVEYNIFAVDVNVSIKQEMDLPPALLELQCNAFELIPKDQQDRLNELAGTHGVIAKRAHAYWLEILRWVVRDGTLSRPLPRTTDTGWATCLEEPTSGHQIWAETQILRVTREPTISVAQWEDMQARLNAGARVPTPWEYLLEAEYLLSIDDHRRAALDAAIALEAFVRSRLESALPGELHARFRTVIRRSRISDLIVRETLEAILGDPLAAKFTNEDLLDLRRLMDRRNRIMHHGQDAEGDLRAEIAALKYFIEVCEQGER